MTREEADFIGALNMCDEISNEAYKKIMCHCEEEEPCEDCISREQAYRHIYKRLYESALNNIGNGDDVFQDIAENRLRTWVDELPSVAKAM